MGERTTERLGAAERPQESGAAAPGRGGRMSRQRKRDAVLRLLRGEDLETVSRLLGFTAATLTTWRDAFLAAGEAALAARPTDGETLESERLKARLGDMLLKHELLEQKIISLEGGRPLARRRWKR
jgi:transposase